MALDSNSTPKKVKILETPFDDDDDDPKNSKDMISNLPQDIVHYILSFLQTIDVVRTSLLSKKWRYLWTLNPYLDFDIEPFYMALLNKSYVDSLALIPLTQTFKDFVNWVLTFQNRSSDIQRFRLWCLNFYDKWTIIRWVHVAVERNVRQLDLSICQFEPFELPNWLLACESLIVLKLNLSHCVLKLPRFGGFSRLTSLELECVKLEDEDLAENFFLSCPQLENLRMDDCVVRDLKVLDISSTSLKNLSIKNINSDLASGDGDDDEEEDQNHGLFKSELKVSCPNLVSFEFIGPTAYDYSLHDLCSLERALIHLTAGSEQGTNQELGYRMCKILKGLYSAKILKLSMVFVELLHLVLDKPQFFSTPLHNLKSLELCVGLDQCYMEVIIHLLKYCPNLQALVLLLMETCEWIDYWPIQDEAITCFTNHLKVVELYNANGQENELELVRFLLKNGHALEKITWSTYLRKPTEIIQKILGFPKSSSDVLFTFLLSKAEVEFSTL